jgi:chitodextrinase
MTMTSANSSNNRPYTLSKPRISLLEDNALVFSTLKAPPTISFSYSAEANKKYYISLYCQGTSCSGQDIRLDILESKMTSFESEKKTSEAELQLEYLSQLADNSTLMITLSIKSGLDETQDERNSSTHFINFYQAQPARLEPFVAQNNWMTEISHAIGHMYLRELLLPGAHNAGVDQDNSHFPDELWGACQDYTFDYQLENGIRVFDCRVKDIDPGNGYFQFRHGNYHSWHVLSDLINKTKAFLSQHPQEIIIFDFHEFYDAASFDYARFGNQMNQGMGSLLLPPEAQNMTINEIRTKWPNRRVALCCDPVPYALHWPKIPHTWSGQSIIDAGELNRWVNSVMQNPPIQQMWSLSATAYNMFTGPVRISAHDKVFIDLFTPLHTPAPGVNFKGNIINVDFFQNTNVVDNCIYINRMRGAVPDTIPPTTPTNFTTRDLTNSAATVTWDESTDNRAVIGYVLTLNNNLPITTSLTSHTFNNLNDATSYVIEIKAKDAAGNLSAPASIEFKIGDITPPSKPTNAHYVPLSNISAKIIWTASTDNIGVMQYELTLNDETPITIADTHYTFSDLPENLACIVKIKAKDASGNLSEPAIVLFVTWSNLPPYPPSNLQAIYTTPTSVLVSWRAAFDPDGNISAYSISLDDAPPITVYETIHSYTDLSAAPSHSIEIWAIDNKGKHSAPAALTFASPDTPSAPLNFRGVNGFVPRISWNAPAVPADLIGYSITITGPSGAPKIWKTGGLFLNPALLINRDFHVEITAYNGVGHSLPLLGTISTKPSD